MARIGHSLFADESYIDTVLERLFVLGSTPRKIGEFAWSWFLTITTFPRKGFAPYYITSQEHSVAAQMAYVFKRGEFKVAQCLYRVADVARVFIRWIRFFRNTRQNASNSTK